MKSLVDVGVLVLGVAAAVFAILEFYWFGTSPGREGHTSHLWMAIAAAAVACACALIFFVRRVNKDEEIHITS